MEDVIRIVIAVAIGAGVFALGRWGIRLLAMPPRAEPEPDEVVAVEVPFVCSVCGMRLTVTHAQDEEWTAPRHCREEMELAL